jgi:hypothetical protein
METRRSGGFPADLLTVLVLPAFFIFAAIFGPQRIWLFLLIVGCFQIAAASFVLRSAGSSVSAWLAFALGILAAAAGIGIALTPL